MRGKVKMVAEGKGFGFISRDGSRDLFFHATKVVDHQFDAIRVGDEVEFTVDEGPKGEFADNVQLVNAR